MKKLTTLIALGTLVSALALNVSLAGAEVGGVTASGTNNAKITVTIADAFADFGSNLDPSGIDSNSSDTALDYQGSFYVWKSGGMAVSVKSNKVWNGTVQAAENIGTSTSMSIASGVLTYVESSAPTTYAACSAGTAFATTASTWKSSVAKGSSAYTVYYCLRVDWDDDPGTFSSSITYTATQA